MTTSAIVGWAWEGTLLVLATELLLGRQRRLGAAARHAIWMAVLLAVAAWPLRLVLLATATPPSTDVIPMNDGAGLEPLSIGLPALPPGIADLLVLAWIGWAALHAARLVGAYVRVRRIAARATPLPTTRQATLAGWTTHRTIGRRATLAVTDALAMPAALGLGSSCIVLPRDVVQNLPDADLDRVVLHELAHLRRRDDWTQLLQGVVQAAVGFHPAVRWIGRQLEFEREAACDAFVVRHTGDARAYAACLAQVAARSLRRKGLPALASGAGRAGRQLEGRVRRVLDPTRRPWPLAAAVLAVPMNGALVTAGVGLMASLVVFDERPAVSLDVRMSASSEPPAVAVGPDDRGRTAGTRQASVALSPVAVRAATNLERPSARARRRPEVVAPAASAVGFEASPVDEVEAAGRLPSAPVPGMRLSVPPSPGSADRVDQDERRNVWVTTGSTVGSSVEKAGVRTAGALTRVSRSIASAFSTVRE